MLEELAALDPLEELALREKVVVLAVDLAGPS
jgi:hypothetical protein